MSAWTCEKCGWAGRHTQKSGHKRFKCPKHGEMLRAMQRESKAAAKSVAEETPEGPAPEQAAPAFWMYLPCLCCGEHVGQVKGQKRKEFVDSAHYDKWRRRMQKESEEDGEPDFMLRRRHAEEVASKVAKETAIAREAESVRMVTGQASLELWARCLWFER